MDLVAGNLGLNSKYKATPEAPFEVFAGDLDENGTHDIVLAYRQNNKLFPVRDRLTMIKQFPFIGEKFPTFESFSIAEIKDIFSADMLERSLHFTINNFASAYFENTGDGKFIRHTLSNEAQLSAVNTILPADVNGDGIPDIILTGNIFEMEAETVRQDASFGLCMLGDGKGGFTSIPWKKSGFSIDGNVKHGVLMNHGNGRILVFAKNGEYVQVVKITQ
jgi:enediyne biosynthesis protein E4